MLTQRLAALAIVMVSSTVLRVNVIPTVDEFFGPQRLRALITTNIELQPDFQMDSLISESRLTQSHTARVGRV